MPELITRKQLRITGLYGGLLVIFGCAWAADAWPQFTILALCGAAVAIVLQVSLLYFLAQPRIAAANAPDNSSSPMIDPATEFARMMASHAVAHHRAYKMALAPHSLQLGRIRASQVATWSLLASGSDHSTFMQAVGERRLSGAIPTELKDWILTEAGSGAFNISAGAFEIEHFHGKTHIRVLDDKSVTVSGTGLRTDKGLPQVASVPELSALYDA